MYGLNKNYECVNYTEAEIQAGVDAMTREQMLDRVNYLLAHEPSLDNDQRYRLETIRKNILFLLTRDGIFSN